MIPYPLLINNSHGTYTAHIEQKFIFFFHNRIKFHIIKLVYHLVLMSCSIVLWSELSTVFFYAVNPHIRTRTPFLNELVNRRALDTMPLTRTNDELLE